MIARPLVLLTVLISGGIAIAAPALKPEAKKGVPLAGTTWVGETAEGWEMTIEFRSDGRMHVSYRATRFETASWTQHGDKLYWEMNDRYCEFNGKIAGDKLEGNSHNTAGHKWVTKMKRITRD